MSSFNCCLLTSIQVSQQAGQVVWYSHLFQNFPQFVVIHTVKGFGIVNKAGIDVFLELSSFFNDPVNVGNLISGSFAFSKTSLNIRMFTVHVLLKHGFENFEHYWDQRGQFSSSRERNSLLKVNIRRKILVNVVIWNLFCTYTQNVFSSFLIKYKKQVNYRFYFYFWLVKFTLIKIKQCSKT